MLVHKRLPVSLEHASVEQIVRAVEPVIEETERDRVRARRGSQRGRCC
jgi:hypothetical protein